MLDAIRKWNIGIKIILGIVILSFVIFYAGTFRSLENDPARHMAAVGSYQIGMIEFENMVRLLEDQQKQFLQKGSDLNPQMQAFFRQQAVNTLIDRKLLLIEAKKNGMVASEDEIKRNILQSPYFSVNGQFVGMADYQQRVDMLFHMDLTSFEKMVAEDILVRKYTDLLTAGLLVTDKEVEDQFRKTNLTAKIDYVQFQSGEANDIQVTPEEAKAYYDSHRNEFQTGEQRRVQYLWVRHDSEKNKVQIPEAKLKEYYDSHAQEYSRPEQVKARHILLSVQGKDDAAVKKQAEDLVKQLRSGADFAEMAKKYSDDAGSKVNGGDLGFFERGRMVPEFEQVAFSMAPNQISDPVKTQFGYHIIQVQAKQPAYKMEFALVKDQIAQRIGLQQEIKNAEDQADKIYDEITKNKKNMSDISKVQLVDLKSTDYFSENEDLPGLSPAFRQRAFELGKGEVGKPVEVFQDYAVIQMLDTKASEVPTFEKVQAKAMQKVRQQKTEDTARVKAQQFYDSLGTSTDLKAAADKEKIQLKTSDAFPKGGYIADLGNNPEISEKAFDMKVNEISKPVKAAEGYVIFQLKEKKDFTPADLVKNRDTIRQQLLNEKQNAFLQTYRGLLRKKYEKSIWVNQEAIAPKEA